MCRVRFAIILKALPQVLQENGVNPEWTLKWVFKSSFFEYDFPHLVQEKGLSSEKRETFFLTSSNIK